MIICLYVKKNVIYHILFVSILKRFHLFGGYFVYHSILLLKEAFTLSVEETACRAAVWGCSLWSQME